MMSDKASVFETVSTRILSLALEFVTPRRQSLSWNWVFLRQLRAPGNCEFDLCVVPTSPMGDAKITNEIDVHPISLILLKFF